MFHMSHMSQINQMSQMSLRHLTDVSDVSGHLLNCSGQLKICIKDRTEGSAFAFINTVTHGQSEQIHVDINHSGFN